jgi:hypothetical protein
VSAQSDKDASTARNLAELAQSPSSAAHRTTGPDRLIALAQVYATLATRA